MLQTPVGQSTHESVTIMTMSIYVQRKDVCCRNAVRCCYFAQSQTSLHSLCPAETWCWARHQPCNVSYGTSSWIWQPHICQYEDRACAVGELLLIKTSALENTVTLICKSTEGACGTGQRFLKVQEPCHLLCKSRHGACGTQQCCLLNRLQY